MIQWDVHQISRVRRIYTDKPAIYRYFKVNGFGHKLLAILKKAIPKSVYIVEVLHIW